MLSHKYSFTRFLLGLFCAFTTLPLAAQSTLYWDPNGPANDTVNLTGTWDASTTAHWSWDASGNGAFQYWNAGDIAVFTAGDSNSTSFTVTVNGTVDVSEIWFSDGTPTLAGGTLQNLHTIDASVSRTSNIGSAITGTQSLTKSGAGSVILSGANSYSGVTNLNLGSLTFAAQQAFYNGTVNATTAGNLTIAAGTTINFGVGDTGYFSAADIGTIVAHANFSGVATLGLDTSNAANGIFTLNADINSLSVDQVTKLGTGTLRLTGDNALDTPIDIQAGILSYGDTGAFYDGVISAETAGNLTVGYGVAVAFGVGGDNAFTLGDIALIRANANIASGGYLGLDTTDVVGGIYDFTHDSTDAFAKTGSGTMRLTGTNTGTGTLWAAGGTLQIGDGGSVSLANSIIADAAVVFDHSNDFTYSNTLSGSGTFTKTGSGVLTLPNMSEFTGLATVSAGTLDLGDNAFNIASFNVTTGGILRSGPGGAYLNSVTIDGAGSQFEAASGSNDTTIFTAVSFYGSPASEITVRNGGALTGSGLILGYYADQDFSLNIESGGTVTADFVTVGSENSTEVNATITGTGSTLSAGLSEGGGGLVVGFTSGRGVVSVTSDGTVIANTIQLGVGNGEGVLNIDAGGTVATKQVQLANNNDSLENTPSGTLNLNSGGILQVTSADLGESDESIESMGGSATINFAGGTLKIVDNNFTSSAAITLSNSSTVDVADTLNAGLVGVLAGSGALAKTGTGTLTLSGANTYAGNTTIAAGTLALGADGSLESSVITVDNGALFDVSAVTAFTLSSGQTLGGSGAIDGLTTIGSGATLAPGNSPGTITFNDGLTLDAGAILEFQLGTVSDLIRVSGGTLTGPSSGTVTLNLSDAGGFTDGTYTLFDYTSATLSDFDTTDFTIGTSIAGYDYSFTLTGTALQLIAVTSAVPEPSTYAAILGLGALGFVAWRKRRRG